MSVPAERFRRRLLKMTAMILILMTMMNAQAYADQGIVVHEDDNCAIIYTNAGYVLVEWYGGALFIKGSTIAGDLNSYGMKEVFDLTQDQEINVWIEDFWLSRAGQR